MKKLFYLTAMAFFFAMSVSFSPPDPVSDPDSYRETISADVEYVADVVAQADVDVAVSFVAVPSIAQDFADSGSISVSALVPEPVTVKGGILISPNPDRNLIYDVGDGTSEDSNFQSNHVPTAIGIRIDRPIDPGWCSSK
jgi:hypothetical protein